MKPIGIKRNEFLELLNSGKRCYVRKPKSWQKIWFWWEMDHKDPNERWFMNVYRESNKGKGSFKEAVWITAKDLNNWFDYFDSHGYHYYE